jgi:hypothetical protein
LKYLNIVLIYKENERGKEKNSRVALLVQHNWKPFLKKNKPYLATTTINETY